MLKQLGCHSRLDVCGVNVLQYKEEHLGLALHLQVLQSAQRLNVCDACSVWDAPLNMTINNSIVGHDNKS